MSIEVKQLTKNYGLQRAVDEVSFTVAPGEIVGFLGPNGAGKSTTMKMITGYLIPDSGEVQVCGIPVRERPADAKARTGYLPEANPLYYDMYVREYLDFIAGIHQVDQPSRRKSHAIELTGLGPESDKKIGQLSKGYKQRVGLAAALLHDPEVLILDEPTTGLDPNQIMEIREVIRSLGKSKTILFSSHILQEVEALCERVIIIHKGKLVADSSLQALRSGQRGSQLQVEFREMPGREKLLSLPAVLQAHSSDGRSWVLSTENEDALRKQLLELSLQQNLNIVSLQATTTDLEDIFRKLTATPVVL